MLSRIRRLARHLLYYFYRCGLWGRQATRTEETVRLTTLLEEATPLADQCHPEIDLGKRDDLKKLFGVFQIGNGEGRRQARGANDGLNPFIGPIFITRTHWEF